MQRAGCIFRVVMTKRSNRNTVVRKGTHLRDLGISTKTRTTYKKMLSQFFTFLRYMDWPNPHNDVTLDLYASEFINHLFQEGEPHGYAGNFVSALVRFFPSCRRSLFTTRMYYKNWERELSRNRALPISLAMLQGIVGLALVRKRIDLAATLLVAFAGLLRTGEFITLVKRQLVFSPGMLSVVVSLPRTKTTGWRGQPESVIINDPCVVNALKLATDHIGPDDRIYAKSPAAFGKELKWLCATFGFQHSRLTPYCLRRGGATWCFMTTGSLDATTARGRWQHSATARLYIDGCTAEATCWTLSERGELLRSKCAAFARNFLATR